MPPSTRLPPLSALRFFEVAGRLQSFKLAAAELNVTPSAVSHGIVSLEQSLGVTLFVREPRKLTLTPEGADYLRHISQAFALIATGTQRLPGRDRHHRSIAVSCAPTLASRWLLPRLPAFRAHWPDTSVTVDTSQRQVNLLADGFDFAIRMSRVPVLDANWARLFGEQLVPVCSPAYRERLLDAHGEADLRRATLIHVSPASEDWSVWLAHAGLKDVDANRGLRFDTIQMAFEAAIGDLGVALGRRPLVDRDLEAGTLVELCPQVVDAETAYWLVSSQDEAHRPDVSGFKHWLLQEARSFEDRRL
ncbi:LysR substrate-binding domain-containing protein [Herbaspirillum rhizosphaerae]|uniref:LysR substrate-binding domain-containing protein n=1 Tax=Herbaspirillum rhizosphaerae TaxID=346179 RepID=UPI00067BCBD4|nr:LysR substrate-binding domain-containing protein [Herbaspirillum rhizosphaerae]